MSRQQDLEKRKKIIKSAFDAFGVYGFRNTTIKDIAEKADIAPGTVYTYFSDKEELFTQAVLEGWRRFLDEMQRTVDAADSYSTKLNKVVDCGFDMLKKAHPLLRGMFSEANRKDLLRGNIDELCENIEELFARSKGNSIFRNIPDKETRTFFIRMIVLGVLYNASLTPPEKLDPELVKMKQHIKDGFLTSLLNGE
ncbi:MAG: TetR/AcrR family transcriptional regulator [Spirochaetia bacterium]